MKILAKLAAASAAVALLGTAALAEGIYARTSATGRDRSRPPAFR